MADEAASGTDTSFGKRKEIDVSSVQSLQSIESHELDEWGHSQEDPPTSNIDADLIPRLSTLGLLWAQNDDRCDPVNSLNAQHTAPDAAVLVNHPSGEAFGDVQQRDLACDIPRSPTDYELFLAKSREEYDRDLRRNWPMVEIDEESSAVKNDGSRNFDMNRVLTIMRHLLRVVQAFVRFICFLRALTLAH